MNNTTKHIGSLLYKHNCVIVPNFGGFVGNYSEAKVHPTQHSFSPPAKRIAFNKNLISNDGLLANTIAAETAISYSDAIEQIAICVSQIKTELTNGNKIEINDVGTLSLDVEKNIQFKPSNTNFSLDSFGLSDVQSFPVLKTVSDNRPATLFVNREPIKETPSKKKKYKRIALLALGLPVLLGVLFVSVNSKPLNNFNYASILPSNIMTTSLFSENDNSVNNNVASPAVNTTVTAKLASETEAAVSSQKSKYHIVIGCFQEKSNADKFIEKLNRNNLNAAIAGKNDKDLFVISGGDFNSKDEAYKQLSKIKELQPDAWLFTHTF